MSVVRRVLVEDHDGVDARERGEDLGALGLRVIGRSGPLLARTDRSEFTPTMSASPSAARACR